ncbi:hypothetical protein D3C86_2156790 [compost metagenome]
MPAIGDEARGQAIVSKLRPDEIRVPGKLGGRTIAEMGGKAGAGAGRRMDLL